MKIQIIDYDKSTKCGNEYEYTYSTIHEPYSLDSFDVNIITLQNSNIWVTRNSNFSTLEILDDFRSLNELLLSSKKAINIVCYPLNYDFILLVNSSTKELKNCLHGVQNIMEYLIPADNIPMLLYENCQTKCNNVNYSSSFTFKTALNRLTTSDGSEQPSTIKVHCKNIRQRPIILTTLNLFNAPNRLKDFFMEIGIECKSEVIPEWVNNIDFYNDKTQKESILSNQQKIDILQAEIKKSQEQLDENTYYKKILCTSGDELVQPIFKMMEQMLVCDLSEFEDVKKEDFLIKLSDITFIGEIKGITSNVKSEHISQLDVHYHSYLDELQDSETTENVKALLIINPFRNTPVSERKPVHDNQITLAQRNESLIITTDIFLKIFEKFLNKEIDTAKILDLFKSQTGLLTTNDF